MTRAGKSRGVIARCLDTLIPEGWLVETGLGVAFGPALGVVVGVSVGRERVRSGVFDGHGRRLADRTSEVVGEQYSIGVPDRGVLTDVVRRDVSACLAEVPGAGSLRGVGIAWPVAIAVEGGEPVYPRELWEESSIEEFAEGCRDVLGDAPLDSVNDANAELLAEYRWGVARGSRAALGVKICGGLGAASILDGRLHLGAHGYAGELGHVVVGDVQDISKRSLPRGVKPLKDAAPCSCGRMDHLERFASARAVIDRLERFTKPGGYTARAAELRERGDEEAVRMVMSSAGKILGKALVPAMLALDPDLVVLSAMPYHENWLTAVRAELADVRGSTRVELGTAPEDGGDWMAARGAAGLAVDRRLVPELDRRARAHRPSALAVDGASPR